MSELEMINQKVAARKAAVRKEAIKQLAKLFVTVAVVLLAFVGLEYIGFISKLFMLILITITICAGFFNAGRVWSFVRR